jgi:serine/threonine protein kinase
MQNPGIIGEDQAAPQMCATCGLAYPKFLKSCPCGGKSLGDTRHDFLIGTLLSERYMIESVIGRGSMGIVYKATHAVIGRPVAIKTLGSNFSSEERKLKRFMREAQTTSRLTHPNIIAVHDAGFTPNGLPYLVMDYIEGASLSEVIRSSERLDVARSINIGIQVCAALAHAHEQGIVHRDLKPSNIMLVRGSASDARDFVKVVDFGIAKMASTSDDGNYLTRTGEVIGTPVYMSPEQCISMPLDERSDIYSFGVVLYEILAGTPPFRGDNPGDTIRKHLINAPSPFQERGITDIPKPLEKIVFRCLSKRPEDRYPTMRKLQHELEAIYLALCGFSTAENVATGKKAPLALPEENTEQFRVFLEERMKPVLDPVPEDSTGALRQLIREADQKKSGGVTVRGPKAHKHYTLVLSSVAVCALALATALLAWVALHQPATVKHESIAKFVSIAEPASNQTVPATANAFNVHTSKISSHPMFSARKGSESKNNTKLPAAVEPVPKIVGAASSAARPANTAVGPTSAARYVMRAKNDSTDRAFALKLARRPILYQMHHAIETSVAPGVVTNQSRVSAPQRFELIKSPKSASGETAAQSSPPQKEKQLQKVAVQTASELPPQLKPASRDTIVQLNNHGLEAMNSGNFPGAIEKFETALRLDSSYAKARHNLCSTYNNYALILHQSGQLGKAEHYYKKAVALHATTQDLIPVLQNYAALLQATNRDSEAAKIEAQLESLRNE